MKRVLTAAALCILPSIVGATPVTRFEGDRYAADSSPQVPTRDRRVLRARTSRTSEHAPSIGGRPAHCPARRWCGCWLASHLGLNNRSLWLAYNWKRIGRPSHATVGSIVVFSHSHVGKITDVGEGRIRVLSGNDGRAVRNRWRPITRGMVFRSI